MRSNAVVISTSVLRRIVLSLVALLIVLGLVVVARQVLPRFGVTDILSPGYANQIDRGAYQGVFLTGGQVFFGKAQASGDYLLLSDIFYLSAGSDTQPSQLIKRGQEVHGPREPMVIPNASVLFIENLREDGTVATAIRKFKAGEIPTATPAPIAPTPSPSARPSASR